MTVSSPRSLSYSFPEHTKLPPTPFNLIEQNEGIHQVSLFPSVFACSIFASCLRKLLVSYKEPSLVSSVYCNVNVVCASLFFRRGRRIFGSSQCLHHLRVVCIKSLGVRSMSALWIGCLILDHQCPLNNIACCMWLFHEMNAKHLADCKQHLPPRVVSYSMFKTLKGYWHYGFSIGILESGCETICKRNLRMT